MHKEPEKVPEKFTPSFKLKTVDEIKEKKRSYSEENNEIPSGVAEEKAGSPIALPVEQIKAHINEYARLHQAKGNMNMFVMLHERPVALAEGNTVLITLSNQIQKELFEQTKTELAAFLRSKPGCENGRLEAVINEEESAAGNSKLYTNKEKYNRMLERFPLLLDLQKTLGLEPEY